MDFNFLGNSLKDGLNTVKSTGGAGFRQNSSENFESSFHSSLMKQMKNYSEYANSQVQPQSKSSKKGSIDTAGAKSHNLRQSKTKKSFDGGSNDASTEAASKLIRSPALTSTKIVVNQLDNIQEDDLEDLCESPLLKKLNSKDQLLEEINEEICENSGTLNRSLPPKNDEKDSLTLTGIGGSKTGHRRSMRRSSVNLKQQLKSKSKSRSYKNSSSTLSKARGAELSFSDFMNLTKKEISSLLAEVELHRRNLLKEAKFASKRIQLFKKCIELKGGIEGASETQQPGSLNRLNCLMTKDGDRVSERGAQTSMFASKNQSILEAASAFRSRLESVGGDHHNLPGKLNYRHSLVCRESKSSQVNLIMKTENSDLMKIDKTVGTTETSLPKTSNLVSNVVSGLVSGLRKVVVHRSTQAVCLKELKSISVQTENIDFLKEKEKESNKKTDAGVLAKASTKDSSAQVLASELEVGNADQVYMLVPHTQWVKQKEGSTQVVEEGRNTRDGGSEVVSGVWGAAGEHKIRSAGSNPRSSFDHHKTNNMAAGLRRMSRTAENLDILQSNPKEGAINSSNNNNALMTFNPHYFERPRARTGEELKATVTTNNSNTNYMLLDQPTQQTHSSGFRVLNQPTFGNNEVRFTSRLSTLQTRTDLQEATSTKLRRLKSRKEEPVYKNRGYRPVYKSQQASPTVDHPETRFDARRHPLQKSKTLKASQQGSGSSGNDFRLKNHSSYQGVSILENSVTSGMAMGFGVGGGREITEGLRVTKDPSNRRTARNLGYPLKQARPASSFPQRPQNIPGDQSREYLIEEGYPKNPKKNKNSKSGKNSIFPKNQQKLQKQGRAHLNYQRSRPKKRLSRPHSSQEAPKIGPGHRKIRSVEINKKKRPRRRVSRTKRKKGTQKYKKRPNGSKNNNQKISRKGVHRHSVNSVTTGFEGFGGGYQHQIVVLRHPGLVSQSGRLLPEGVEGSEYPVSSNVDRHPVAPFERLESGFEQNGQYKVDNRVLGFDGFGGVSGRRDGANGLLEQQRVLIYNAGLDMQDDGEDFEILDDFDRRRSHYYDGL